MTAQRPKAMLSSWTLVPLLLAILAAIYLSDLSTPQPLDLTPSEHIDMSLASVSRQIAKIVRSIEKPEVRRQFPFKNIPLLTVSQGAGARVRRSIGAEGLKNLTPFVMLDHFHISKGAVSSRRDFSITAPANVLNRVSPTTLIVVKQPSLTSLMGQYFFLSEYSDFEG
jgi:hypothetical protein